MALTLKVTISTDSELQVGIMRILEACEFEMLRFGRAMDSDVRMTQENKRISRHHAHIHFGGESFLFVDISKNGSMLNEVVMHGECERLWGDGDHIAIGQYEFRALLDERPHEPGDHHLHESGQEFPRLPLASQLAG